VCPLSVQYCLPVIGFKVQLRFTSQFQINNKLTLNNSLSITHKFVTERTYKYYHRPQKKRSLLCNHMIFVHSHRDKKYVLTLNFKKNHYVIDKTSLRMTELYLSCHPVPDDSSLALRHLKYLDNSQASDKLHVNQSQSHTNNNRVANISSDGLNKWMRNDSLHW
jgi:hypothetical protein